MNDRHVALWLEETGKFVHSGIPLIEAMEMAEALPAKEKTALLSALRSGVPVKTAFEETASFLKPHEREAIGSASEYGYLPLVMKQLADVRLREASHRRIIWTASLYPLFTLLLCLFIAPMGRLLQSDGYGGLEFTASAYLRELFYLTGGISLICIALVLAYYLAKDLFMKLVMKLPMLSGYVRFKSLSAFCGVLGSTLRAGIPIAKALRMAGRAGRTEEMQDVASAMAMAADEGHRPSMALSSTDGLPMEFVSAVRTGEELGELDKQMMRMAKLYDEKASGKLMMASFWYPKIPFLAAMIYVAYTIIKLFAGYLDIFDQIRL